MWGCMRGSRTTDAACSRWSLRVAQCRSIRLPRRLSRIGPLGRSPTARSIARPTAGGSGTSTTFEPFPNTRKTRWPCSSPTSAMSAPHASKIRKPSNPSMVTNAKSKTLLDWRAAVSSASNCRCQSPSVGDSGGTIGRRTWSAGEYSTIPSITQMRYKPVTTAMRRATVEGLNWRTSCIHRTNRSMSARCSVSGARWWSLHQAKNNRRSDSVCARDVPV
jgi:hypothetical protein